MAADFSIADNHSDIAVAVSGGGDSMALVHRLSCWAGNDHLVHALIVDHGLRPESALEMEIAAARLAGLPNVKVVALRWEGEKPTTRIMEAARAARYQLMAGYCRAYGIRLLALAHHRDDQAETFLMRLAHGSGLDGLGGMRVLQTYDDAVTLWRPLLGESHEDLIAWCRDNAVEWVEDPTNNNQKYTRSRLRASRDVLAAEGLSSNRLGVTAARLSRASEALHELSTRLSARAMLAQTGDMMIFDLGMLRAEPRDLAIRVVREALKTMDGGQGYGARYEKVENATLRMLDMDGPAALSVGGYTLRRKSRGTRLELVREQAGKSGKTLLSGTDGI